MSVGDAHDQRAEAPHLLVQQADRAGHGAVRPERIRADQFAQPARLVRGRHASGPHLVQHDRNVAGRQLPGGFAAGEAAADDVYRALREQVHARDQVNAT
jgi:hypothetical protein